MSTDKRTISVFVLLMTEVLEVRSVRCYACGIGNAVCPTTVIVECPPASKCGRRNFTNFNYPASSSFALGCFEWGYQCERAQSNTGIQCRFCTDDLCVPYQDGVKPVLSETGNNFGVPNSNSGGSGNEQSTKSYVPGLNNAMPGGGSGVPDNTNKDYGSAAYSPKSGGSSLRLSSMHTPLIAAVHRFLLLGPFLLIQCF